MVSRMSIPWETQENLRYICFQWFLVFSAESHQSRSINLKIITMLEEINTFTKINVKYLKTCSKTILKRLDSVERQIRFEINALFHS